MRYRCLQLLHRCRCLSFPSGASSALNIRKSRCKGHIRGVIDHEPLRKVVGHTFYPGTNAFCAARLSRLHFAFYLVSLAFCAYRFNALVSGSLQRGKPQKTIGVANMRALLISSAPLRQEASWVLHAIAGGHRAKPRRMSVSFFS